MNIPFTVEELERFALNGTLESHILSNGLLPLEVLNYFIKENAKYIATLNENMVILEREVYRS